jgi:hypothetical protein
MPGASPPSRGAGGVAPYQLIAPRWYLKSAKIQGFVRARRIDVRVHRGLPALADRPVALTIGNFDGVHRGHQAMLSRLIEAADDLGLPSAVLTFDPHPREFFARDLAPRGCPRCARNSNDWAYGIERGASRA